ncbi:DNA-binding protein [Thermithiobacillus plumbiphilus]|uniref:DNA-binding protein n=1 Tax=Thermithiobacillus plumbiphilus TaxID=1729899 RepID=A0ABU9D4A4_9PROT
MARIGISFEDVRDAALKLQDQDLLPTVERVRAQLGSGSHSTIARHLRDWRTQQEKPAEGSPLPPAALNSLGAAWQALQEETTQALEQSRQQAQAEKTALESQLADALRVTQEHAIQIESFGIARRGLERRLSRERLQHHQAQRQLQHAQVSAVRAQQTSKALKMELNQARSELEKVQAQAHQRETQLRAEMADLREGQARQSQAFSLLESALRAQEADQALLRSTLDIQARQHEGAINALRAALQQAIEVRDTARMRLAEYEKAIREKHRPWRQRQWESSRRRK